MPKAKKKPAKQVKLSKIDSKTRWLLIAVFAVIGAAIITTSFAARNTLAAGSCSVSPNPVTVGADYVLTGTNLGANTLVNVLISDSNTTSAWNLSADSNGTSVLTTHSYWKGTSTVKYQVLQRHKYTVIATCSFQVN